MPDNELAGIDDDGLSGKLGSYLVKRFYVCKNLSLLGICRNHNSFLYLMFTS